MCLCCELAPGFAPGFAAAERLLRGIVVEHVAGRGAAAHPAVVRHAFHQVGGIRDGGRDGLNERVIARHLLLGQQVDAALVGQVVALLQLRL